MTLGVEGYLVKANLSLQELCDRVIAILHGKARGGPSPSNPARRGRPVPAEGGRVDPPWVEGAARMAKRKILIVDDDRLAQRTLNVLLAKNQYDTVVAADAVLALALARKEKPDLILLDIGLPGGGGLTVLERLRGIAGLGGIPVIVVSATDANREPALSAGAEGFFLKPVDGDVLLAVIRRTLGES
jgi:CheY-like chemotaxis protein